MSEIGSPSILVQSKRQLPVFWYFDRQMREHRQELLFENGPGTVGHALMVPNTGDCHTLAWMDHAKFLVANAQGLEPLPHVCRIAGAPVNRHPAGADQT